MDRTVSLMDSNESPLWDFHSTAPIKRKDVDQWMSDTLSPQLNSLETSALTLDCLQLMSLVALTRGKSPGTPLQALLLISELYEGLEVSSDADVAGVARALGDYRTQGIAGERWARAFLALDQWGTLGRSPE